MSLFNNNTKTNNPQMVCTCEEGKIGTDPNCPYTIAASYIRPGKKDAS